MGRMSGFLTFLRNARPNPEPVRIGLEDLTLATRSPRPPFSAGGLYASRPKGAGPWRVQVVVRDALNPRTLVYAEATVKGTPAAVEAALRGLALALREADVAPRWALNVQGQALGIDVEFAGIVRHPLQGRCGIVQRGREAVFRGQPVIHMHHHHACPVGQTDGMGLV